MTKLDRIEFFRKSVQRALACQDDSQEYLEHVYIIGTMFNSSIVDHYGTHIAVHYGSESNAVIWATVLNIIFRPKSKDDVIMMSEVEQKIDHDYSEVISETCVKNVVLDGTLFSIIYENNPESAPNSAGIVKACRRYSEKNSDGAYETVSNQFYTSDAIATNSVSLKYATALLGALRGIELITNKHIIS